MIPVSNLEVSKRHLALLILWRSDWLTNKINLTTLRVYMYVDLIDLKLSYTNFLGGWFSSLLNHFHCLWHLVHLYQPHRQDSLNSSERSFSLLQQDFQAWQIVYFVESWSRALFNQIHW
jgi:hypothetical protein